MFSKFAKIKSSDEDLMAVQSAIEDVLEPLFTVPIHDGVYLRDVSLSAGSNRVLHKLERPYIGYIICNLRPAGTVTTTAWQSFTPTITGTGGMTWTTSNVYSARYRVTGSTVEMHCTVDGTVATAAGQFLVVAPPVPMKTTSSVGSVLDYALAVDGISRASQVGLDYSNNRMIVYRDPVGTNWTIGAGRAFSFNTFYEPASDYEFGSLVVEGTSSDPSVSLNLISGTPVTASILVY